jgi:hypothetical protein
LRMHRIIVIGQGNTLASGPVLTKTSTGNANPLTWTSVYSGATVFDGSNGTKVDMQWRTDGGAWNPDTRQALTSDVILTGSFSWPLFNATIFNAGQFLEVQERTVPYVSSVAQTPSSWSNTVSATLATGTPFSPSSVTGIKDYFKVNTTRLWKDTGGTVPVTADGDAVARWDSEMSIMSPFTQATSTKRPLYRTNSGNPYLDFDGVDDNMTCGSTGISTITQPYYMMAATKLTALLGSQSVFDGASNGFRSSLAQNNIGSPNYQWEIFAGAFVGTQGMIPTTNDVVVGGLFNSASSKGRIDQTDGSVINISTQVPTTGIIIGSQWDLTAPLGGRIYGLVLIGASPSAGDKTSISTWLAALQGRVI